MGRPVGYGAARGKRAMTRFIAVIPSAEANKVDEWGVSAEMPNRTAAIRHLLKRGLEAEAANPTAASNASQA